MTTSLLAKRALIERTVRLAHAKGKLVTNHAQRCFFPMIHGLGDFWFPGEQNNGPMLKNPYCFTDEFSDRLYRTEFNSEVLGCNIIMCDVSLGDLNKARPGKECQLLLFGIDLFEVGGTYPHTKRLWNFFRKYGIDDNTPFIPFYHQDTVSSLNPELKVSYYHLKGGRFFFILGNRLGKEIVTTLDFSRLGIRKGQFHEECTNIELPSEDGKVKIAVPSRNYRILISPTQEALQD